MSVAEWVLVYEAVGVLIVVIVFGRDDTREFLEGLVTVALFPVLPFTFAISVIRRRRRERKRQASITEKVADGTYSELDAHRLGWKGPKK